MKKNSQSFWNVVKSSDKFVLLSELVRRRPDLEEVVLTTTPEALENELEDLFANMGKAPMLAFLELAPERVFKKHFSGDLSDHIRKAIFEECFKEALSVRELYDILV